MKKIAIVAALGVAGLLSGAANAATATVTGGFNVVVNLTPLCQIAQTTIFGTSATLSDITLNYTSFQGADATGSNSFNVRCASTLPYSVTVSGDATTKVGLDYTLGLTAGALATNYTGGSTGLISETGSTTGKQYTVGAKIASGQGGTCGTNAGCSATTAHVVTITY